MCQYNLTMPLVLFGPVMAAQFLLQSVHLTQKLGLFLLFFSATSPFVLFPTSQQFTCICLIFAKYVRLGDILAGK